MKFISLRNQKEFDFVNKSGIKINSRFFIIIFSDKVPIKAVTDQALFAGFKVSKRFSKKAVVRNKTKRRIRHMIHLSIAQYATELTRKSIIIIPKISFMKALFKDAYLDFTKSITKYL